MTVPRGSGKLDLLMAQLGLDLFGQSSDGAFTVCPELNLGLALFLDPVSENSHIVGTHAFARDCGEQSMSGLSVDA